MPNPVPHNPWPRVQDELDYAEAMVAGDCPEDGLHLALSLRARLFAEVNRLTGGAAGLDGTDGGSPP